MCFYFAAWDHIRQARCTASTCVLSAESRKQSRVNIVLQVTDLRIWNELPPDPQVALRTLLPATPPGLGSPRDGVLRWMEAYADALARGMFKVRTHVRFYGSGHCDHLLYTYLNA